MAMAHLTTKGENLVSGEWDSPKLILTSKMWTTIKGASIDTFGCTKKGFKVPHIAHNTLNFDPIFKCPSILESWLW